MKVYQTHELAKKWQRITGLSLRRFVDILPTGDVIPNTIALENWLTPANDESIENCLRNRYGQTAVDIIYKLFEQ